MTGNDLRSGESDWVNQEVDFFPSQKEQVTMIRLPWLTPEKLVARIGIGYDKADITLDRPLDQVPGQLNQ